MKEYLIYLLHKQKGMTVSELLKKTSLPKMTLKKIIHELAIENKVEFIDLRNVACSCCSSCKYFQKGGQKCFL